MTTNEVEKQLIEEIAVILGTDPSSIETTKPLGDMGIDSMSLVEILVFIEKTFQLKLIESGLAKDDFKTIQSLAKRIHSEREG